MSFSTKITLSVVVVFFNMQREAARTLFSLSRDYQQNIDFEYEILVVDNGSTEQLLKKDVESIGDNIFYRYVKSNSASPCYSINEAVKVARGEYIMCCIDGARILSPNILSKSVQALKTVQHPFIYTLAFHIGPKVQKESLLEGYSREIEDQLLASVAWEENGYELFNISTIAPSSKKGYFNCISETNCFVLKKTDYLNLGGYNELFLSSGGGLSNMELFQRFVLNEKTTPIVLLGEATFHQVHGGAITNQIVDREKKMKIAFDEYERIIGNKYIHKAYDFMCFGSVKKEYDEKYLNVE